MKINFRVLWLLILSIFMLSANSYALAQTDTLASANASSIGELTVDLAVDVNDASTIFLGDIFGPVGSILPGAGNGLLASMFRIFNNTVLTLGAIVLFYTTMMTTINTAQEGEILGRKYSAAIVPLKSTASVALLLPTGSGYSLIQVMVMYFVLKGVAAANVLWGHTLDFVSGGGSINQLPPVSSLASGRSSMSLDAQNFGNQMIKSAVCVSYYTNYENRPSSCRSGSLPVNRGKLVCGPTDRNNADEAICGAYLSDPNLRVATMNADDIAAIQQAGIQAAVGFLGNYAFNAVVKDDRNRFVYKDNTGLSKAQYWGAKADYVAQSVRSYQSFLTAIPTSNSTGNDQVLEEARAAGWIFAGAYYYKLTRAGEQYEPPPFYPQTEDISMSDNRIKNIINQASREFSDYHNVSGQTEMRPPVSAGGQMDSFIGAVLYIFFGAISDAVANDMFDALRTDGDPLLALQKLGFKLMLGIEAAFAITISLCIILLLASSFCSAVQGMWSMMFSFFAILLPAFAAAFIAIWGAGATMALYLPLKPYLIYTLSALGWFIAVIEAMVAAPIVALGLATPSNENLGRASPAVTLLASVFLRPSLMIIGFVIASRLFITVVRLINFGFEPTVEAQIYAQSSNGIGMYGPIMIVIVYVGLITSVIDMCFSLIYAVGDKVMRWIGGQVESSSVAQTERQVSQSFESGSKQAQGLTQSGLTAASKQAKSTRDRWDEEHKEAEKANSEDDGKE